MRPAWAAPLFDAEGWDAFRGEVEAAVGRLGLRARIDDEQGVLRVEGSEGQYGLGNLAQQCASEERDAWAELAESHFRQLIAAEARDTDELAADEALPLLRLRVWAAGDLPDAAELVARPLADDLRVVLSLDLPESVATVHPDAVAEWGLKENELFDRAAEQTRREEVEVERRSTEEGAEIVFCVGDSFFAASHALWPGTVLGDLGEAGALIALPNRHLAVFHAITDMRVVEVTSTLAPFLAARYDEGPGSISPHLYWWRDGETVRLPVSIEGDTVSLMPPDAFVELLNGLAEP